MEWKFVDGEVGGRKIVSFSLLLYSILGHVAVLKRFSSAKSVSGDGRLRQMLLSLVRNDSEA